ncbi:MAG: glycosyltransferase family 4 protein [Peptococcaceae bacterium]|nr:glycosyltransferase family 4 protein [Peptococcaceae bacterium]
MQIFFVHPTDLISDSDAISNYIRGIKEEALNNNIVFIGKTRGNPSSTPKTVFSYLRVPETIKILVLLLIIRLTKRKCLNGSLLSFHQIEWALPFIFGPKSFCIIITIHGFHGHYLIDLVHSKKSIRLILKCWFYKFIEPIILKKADAIICVSKERKRHYLSKYPNLSAKIFYIPPYVNIKKFSPLSSVERIEMRKYYGYDTDDFVGVFLGRLENGKGLQEIIDAVKYLSDSGENIKLLIVGKGSLLNSLQHKVSEACLEDTIKFICQQPHLDIPVILSSCDLLILPSIAEGTPMSVLEALSCGVPVACFSAGDLPLIIDNQKNGFCTEKKDVDGLIQVILKTLSLQENKDCKANCIASVNQYSSSRIIPIILDSYEIIYRKFIESQNNKMDLK